MGDIRKDIRTWLKNWFYTKDDIDTLLGDYTTEAEVIALIQQYITGVAISLTLSSNTVNYGTSVLLTATVTNNGNPVAGETVTFYDGSTSIGTGTTDSTGEATLTKSNFNAGSHSLKAVYSNVDSNTATLTVNKVTPTLSLSASPTTITEGATVTFSGTSSLGSGVTVYILKDGVQYTTVTTGSGGSFSKAVSSLTAGTYSITAKTEADTNHSSVTSSSVSVTVKAYDGITLTSDKSILSASDQEYATLSAQLTNSGQAASVSGETVTFEVRKQSDDSLVETLTGTTNSSGVATVSYYGQGEGDLNIKAICSSLLLETYSIEDCVKYDTTEYTKSYSSTRFETIESVDASSDVSISLDLKTTTYNYSCVFGIGYNSDSDQIGFGTTDTTGRIYRTLNSINNHSSYSGFNSNNVYYNLRFERSGTTLKLYLNDNLIDTSTNNEISSFKYLNFGSWRNKTIYYKNLKIKPL